MAKKELPTVWYLSFPDRVVMTEHYGRVVPEGTRWTQAFTVVTKRRGYVFASVIADGESPSDAGRRWVGEAPDAGSFVASAWRAEQDRSSERPGMIHTFAAGAWLAVLGGGVTVDLADEPAVDSRD